MKYGLVTFPRSENSGDAIQSIAAMQFLPRVDVLLDRETLNEAGSSGEEIAVIGNGWYAHNVDNWPPSPSIRFLPISLHMSPRAMESYFSPKNIQYFRSISPLGARDEFTRKSIASYGVDAYLSGCLTLTLPNPLPTAVRDRIVVCDVSERVLAFVEDRARLPVERLTHAERVDDSIDDKFLRARRLLLHYAQASCVITTRLHAALPALAFGTPVLLIESVDDAYRFDGLREHLRHSSEDEFLAGRDVFDINAPPPNPDTHGSLRESLAKSVRTFLAHCVSQGQNRTHSRQLRTAPTVLQPVPSGEVRDREKVVMSVHKDLDTFGTSKDGEPGEASRQPPRDFEVLQRPDVVHAAELAGLRTRADILRDELAESRQQLRRAQEQTIAVQAQLTAARTDKDRLVSEVETLRQQPKLLDVRIGDLERAQVELAARRDAVEQELGRTRAEAEESKAAARKAQQRLAANTQEGLQLRDSVWNLQNQVAALTEQNQSLTHQSIDAKAQIAEGARERAAITTELDEVRARLADAKTAAEDTARAEIERLHALLADARTAAEGAAREEIEKLQTLLSQAHHGARKSHVRAAAAAEENARMRDSVWQLQNQIKALTDELQARTEQKPAPAAGLPQAADHQKYADLMLSARKAQIRLAGLTHENLALRDAVWRLQNHMPSLAGSALAPIDVASASAQQAEIERLRRELNAVPWKAVKVYRGIRRFVPRPIVYLVARAIKPPKREG